MASIVLLLLAMPWVTANRNLTLAIYSLSLAGALLTFFVLHTGRIRLAGAMFSVIALLLTYIGVFASGGIASPQLATAVLVITITGFLVSPRAGSWMAVLTSLSLLALVYGRQVGVVPEPFISDSPYMTWAALTSIIALSAVFLNVFVGAVTSARLDVAEKSKALEEEMLRREQAEASLRNAEKLEALGRLTGGIAHDFNNILTVLLAESQMLESHLSIGRPVGNEQVEQISEILQSSKRAARLTSQLLAFSRQRVGIPEIIDPNHALERLQPMLRRLVREEIRLNVAPHATAGAVRMDAAQFDQLVMNLVLNACDALPGRGRIVISTEAADCDESWVATHSNATRGPHVVVGVSDTGSGIDSAHLDRIFDPFFTTKDQAQRPGTGLGLATVHGIVTEAGGHVTVESAVGRGTRFCVYLPRSENKSAQAAFTGDASPQRALQKTILMCEDDGPVRSVIRRMLHASEFQVLEAETPERALELARGHDGPIDLLLSDIIMPGMNGRELSDAVREMRPTVAVLLVSGYASNLIDPAKMPPRTAFLEKPFTRDGLTARIYELFSDARDG